MWDLKQCPRCGGDVYIDGNRDKWNRKCLQCGYEQDLERARLMRSGLKNKKSGIYPGR